MPVRSPRQALLPLQFNEELAMPESATDHISTDFVVTHPLDAEDTAITAAMRAMVSSTKGVSRGIEARGQFDAIMESVLPRDDVTIEVATLGGIPGIWVHPANWRWDEAILHLHGGWFNFGSAKAYRHLVGHIAARTGARAAHRRLRLRKRGQNKRKREKDASRAACLLCSVLEKGEVCSLEKYW